jgi:arabinofuranosyltransferase
MAIMTRWRAPAGPEAPSGVRRRPSPTVVVAGLVVLVFAALAWQRLWISDDGLIVVRVIRQILDNSGPNYNPFQRDEVNTSVLWTWLGALVALVAPGKDEAEQLVYFGVLVSAAGLALGLAGAVRFQRSRGERGLVLPAGALVVVGVCAFWDFASSGLETSLCLLWLGLLSTLLATTDETTGRGRLLGTAVLIGLGPLVRPDLGLVTAVLGVALLLLVRPRLPRALGLIGAAAVLPVGYEIFRAGYYGILVPMPALAKEASKSLWGRGFMYLWDFVGTYYLYVPALVLAGLAGWLLRRRADRRALIFFGAPLLSGLLLALYILRVGGDYMHARMWLPAVFAVLLPLMAVPVGRGRQLGTAGVALLAVWAVVAAVHARPPYSGQTYGPGGIVDEREYEMVAFGVERPITRDSRFQARALRDGLRPYFKADERWLILSTGPMANGPTRKFPMSPDIPDFSAFSYSNMGIADYIAPLYTTVVDVNGLATPLAGHLIVNQPGRPGHEKWLPAAWVLALYGDPARIAVMPDHPDAGRAETEAALRALKCGELKELQDSVSAPLTPSRFWANLVGSPARTLLRVPADPFAAEKRFCG